MDLLQIALIFLIMLLGILLSILGIEVFLILKDLKRAVEKLDKVLSEAEEVTEDMGKPVKIVASAVGAIESGVKMVKSLGNKSTKPVKRLFKRR